LSLYAGQRFGPYEILAPLGAGGMGEVFRARDTRLGRTVAIKVLPPALAVDADYQQRFRREARAASALSHPNIAHIYDVGEVDGVHFIAMEFVEGESLAARIAGGPLPEAEIREVALQIGAALEAAHANGVIHRDIKAANVVTGAHGLKVLDFGLARRTAAEGEAETQGPTEALTQAGVVVGTVPYMSPEQARGQPVDARTDLFSLGVLLYELAAGHRPFGGDSALATLHQICAVEPEPLEEVNPAVSEGLVRVIRMCLAKDRDARYRSASALVEDLRRLERGAAPSAPISRPPRPSRRGRWAIAAAATVVVAIVAAALVMRATAGGAINSIVVLPFDHEGGEADAAYMADGVTESLINALSKLPDVKVISRTSAFQFRGRSADYRDIAKELNVRAVLMGRMTQRGDRLAVSAELVDASTDRQLWGERFENASDLLSIERQLSEKVVAKLRLKVSGEAASRVASRGTANPEAYRLFLRGRHFMEGTATDMDKGRGAFEEAVRVDPGYAPAHAAIAEAYLLAALHGTMDPFEAAKAARLKLDVASGLDPDLPESHIVAGNIKLMFDWDYAGARAEFQRALEIAPNSAEAHMEYAFVNWAGGEFDSALVHSQRARDLDPLSRGPMHHVGFTYLASRRYREAVEAFDRALEVHPNWVWGYVKKGIALAYLNRAPEALASAARAETLIAAGGETPLLRAWLGVLYAKAGKTERAREAVARLERIAPGVTNDPVDIAAVHAVLGDREKTLRWLERGYATRSPSMVWIPHLLFFDAFREEPRFRALVEKLQFGAGGKPVT